MKLLSSYKLGPYELKNRMIMAPMTRNRAGRGNAPQPMNALYYAQRAGAGLIITEASQVSPQGLGYPDMPGIYSPEQIAGWRLVTDLVHKRGGLIFLQLFHCGRISHPSLQPGGAIPVAPSAVKPEGEAMTYIGPSPFVEPRALETEEIPGIVEQFRRGAENAREAGFDGVELHAANGYLLDQFLRDGSNQRTDQYGGSEENRTRFLFQVIEAVVNVLGDGRVGIRISPENPFNDISDSNSEVLFSHVAQGLNRFPLAYLHAVEIDLTNPTDYSASLNPLTQKLRGIYKGVYMTNGGYDRDRAERVLERGDADLVSFGRLFLANPDLPERFKKGAPLNEPDERTFYGGDEKGYTDYPFLDSAK
ncbi:MAG: alkene reductase [Deltaproteobacteria bacterium]|nr:MAG: alkene reductase [Deltaproteobacteria bacterium]